MYVSLAKNAIISQLNIRTTISLDPKIPGSVTKPIPKQYNNLQSEFQRFYTPDGQLSKFVKYDPFIINYLGPQIKTLIIPVPTI